MHQHNTVDSLIFASENKLRNIILYIRTETQDVTLAKFNDSEHQTYPTPKHITESTVIGG